MKKKKKKVGKIEKNRGTRASQGPGMRARRILTVVLLLHQHRRRWHHLWRRCKRQGTRLPLQSSWKPLRRLLPPSLLSS